MYRLTIHQRDEKSVDEFGDEDELRDAVESALNDIEHKRIKTFSVSWISGKTYQKPFWEE
mgnify:FL=1